MRIETRYNDVMTRVQTLEHEVRKLSTEELEDFRSWFEKFVHSQSPGELPAEELPGVLARLPRLGSQEASDLARDLATMREELAQVPVRDSWRSGGYAD